MADQLPCPNPACSHVFTLAELQSASAVGCPRCGFRVQGRAAPAAAPPKIAAPLRPAPLKPAPAVPRVPAAVPVAPAIARPVAAPLPKAPAARPVAAPVASPVRPAPGGIDVDLVPSAPRQPAVAPVAPPDRLHRTSALPHRAGGNRGLLRIAVTVAVIALAFCLVSTVVVVLFSNAGFSFGDFANGKFALDKSGASTDYLPIVGNARNVRGRDEKAFRLLLAKNAWTPNKELKTHFAALGAWMSKDDVWLAVAVKDFDTRNPRDAELLQSAIDRLENHFGESLELAAKAEPARFAGLAAQKLKFKGQLDAVAWQGECLMFARQGLAYWVFLAGPTLEDVEPVEAELQSEDTGFAVTADRKGWREQPPRMESFTSDDGKVAMTAPEGVWERSTPSNVEFETGQLLLLGRFVKEKDNQKNAHLQVFTQEKQGDLKAAMKQAREYLEKQKKDQNSGYQFAVAADAAGQSELGMDQDVGNRRGRVAELALSLGGSPVRYYLLAVVVGPDRDTVVLCDCNWRSRQIWRQDFVDLLKTFKTK